MKRRTLRARTVLLAAALAGICTFGQSASQADTSTAATAARKAASERYHHGIELYKHATQTHDPADFERAYLEFAQAYSIYPDDKVLWNLAASELETKRFLAALRHFRTYDAHLHVSDNGQAPDHAKLATYLNRAYGATGHLDIKAPDGAHLSVDGTDAGVAPLSDVVDVEEGAHKVASDGETRSVDAAGGQLVKVVFTGATAGNGATAAGTNATTATPANSSVGPTPLGTNGQQATGADTTPSATHGGGPPLGSWILAGVGVVGIGVGVGFALDGSSQNSKVANLTVVAGQPTSDAVQSAESARSRDRVIAIVGVGAGAVSIAVAGLLWALRKPTSKDGNGSIWMTPTVGAGHAGLALGSSF